MKKLVSNLINLLYDIINCLLKRHGLSAVGGFKGISFLFKIENFKYYYNFKRLANIKFSKSNKIFLHVGNFNVSISQILSLVRTLVKLRFVFKKPD